MRSLCAALAACVAALALLAGCSDDAPSAGDPTSTWTPTSTPDAPTSRATAKPAEPPLPDAATKATEGGARAFIAYYWDLINYAQVTGDVKALKRVSGPHCAGCKAGISGIRDLYNGGGRAEGGEYTLSIRKLNRLQGEKHDFVAFEALLRVRNAEQVIINSTGGKDTLESTANTVAVAALWTKNAWRLEVMDVR
ncbi:MAG TPA: DUF6318 family protein [Nocardioides sp.]|nr:DUF6318 family protein [Nocardioides sp.]